LSVYPVYCVWHDGRDDRDAIWGGGSIFGIRKLESLAIIWHCLHDLMISHLDTILAGDKHTQTDMTA